MKDKTSEISDILQTKNQKQINSNSPPENLCIFEFSGEERELINEALFKFRTKVSEQINKLQSISIYDDCIPKFDPANEEEERKSKSKYTTKKHYKSHFQDNQSHKRQKLTDEKDSKNLNSGVSNSELKSVEVELPITAASKLSDSQINSSKISDEVQYKPKGNSQVKHKTKAIKEDYSSDNDSDDLEIDTNKLQKPRSLCIKNYTRKVMMSNDLNIKHLIKDHMHSIDSQAYLGLVHADKFVKKVIIDTYISFLYQKYYSEKFKFIIIYEGGILDKIEKKHNKLIPKSKGYNIPDSITHHFLLIRDSEKDSKYGVIYIDFEGKKIVHDGPFETEPDRKKSKHLHK